jgi:hypothetical protein
LPLPADVPAEPLLQERHLRAAVLLHPAEQPRQVAADGGELGPVLRRDLLQAVYIPAPVRIGWERRRQAWNAAVGQKP